MGHVDRYRTSVGRSLALATAVATAAVLAIPVAADAWPQVGADGQGTYQADVTGPDDPGLKWYSDVSDDAGDAAPDGFTFEDASLPVIGSDGTIMRRAGAVGQSVGDGNRHIVGIDPDDGSLAWNIPYAQGLCNPAVDSEGRAWAVFVDGTDGEAMLQSFDSATGERTDGTELDPLTDVAPGGGQVWCQSTSLHIGGAGANERAILYDGRGSIGAGSPGILAIDVSGSQAATAWVIDPEDADFGRVQRDSSQDRVGATTDDHLYVPTTTGTTFELTEISLATGAVTRSVELPIFDDNGDPTDPSGGFPTSVLIDGSTAVVSYRFGTGALSAVDLNSFEVAWTEVFIDAPFDQSGPAALALSGGNVVSASGAAPDRLYAHSIANGDPASWSTDSNVRNGNAPRQYLTDSAGAIYVNTSGPEGGRLDRSVTALSASGVQQWRFNRAGLLDATGLTDDVNGLKNDLFLGAIDAGGTLYLYREEQVLAIDGSGGLAIADQCELPFTDVSITSTHGANICRLVELEITGGTTPTTYSPNQQVTRAQMATFLARALDLPAGTGQQFPDVDASSVHAPNILAIRTAGITQGRADGTYDPSGTVTRAEMASFLARSADLDGVNGSGFNDVDPGNVHTPNIYAVRDAEITTGVTATTFNPDGNVRRDQMASFLIRMLDFINEG